MKQNMLQRALAYLTAVLGISLLLSGAAHAQIVSKPQPTPPGSWTLIGTTMANYSVDHDAIFVRGPYDNFREILFKVTEAPLNMHHLVITYDNGQRDEIPVRQKIKKGGKSRVIELHGGRSRSINRIDFWYDTRGTPAQRAEVTVFGRN